LKIELLKEKIIFTNKNRKTKWQDTLRNLTQEKKDINWLKNTKNKVLKDISKDENICNFIL
jgi:hypothetical protein